MLFITRNCINYLRLLDTNFFMFKIRKKCLFNQICNLNQLTSIRSSPIVVETKGCRSKQTTIRQISTKVYDQLLIKGLVTTTFPDNINLNELLSKKQTIYAGFDATNDSLHVGNLLVLITLFHLLHHGHRVIVLIGDATALIGDPSGKIQERQQINKDAIEHNVIGIREDILRVYLNYKQLFAKHSINDDNLILCQNSFWYRDKNVIDFIYTYGRYLRMGDMLSKSSIRERLEGCGLSFAEFSYQIFQAYDWLHLFQKYNCQFQLGGVDQTVNIHNGYDFIKKIAQSPSYALLLPLITDEKGNKIGKSEGKAAFLSTRKTSEFNLFQYFMRLRDSDIARLLKLFSFRPLPEIETMIQQQLKNPKPWNLQKKLATEMTLLVHGKCGLESAERITKALFEKDLDLLGSLPQNELQEVFEGAHEYQLEFIPGNVSVLDLALRTECFDSNLNAIKTIKEGGFYVNYVRLNNPSQILNEDFILRNNITIVGVGKCGST